MNAIGKNLRSYFVTGIFVLFPLVLSLYIIWKIFQFIDNVFPTLTGIDLPGVGLGVVIFFMLILLVGMIAKNYAGKKVIEIGNSIIVSIPVLNKVFLAVQQIMDVVLKPQKNFLGEVVLVEYPKEDSWTLGFVTSRETPEISESIGETLVCVYVPTTPNPTSGFMLYVPEHKIKSVNLSTEIAIKAIVSAGLVSSAKSDLSSAQEQNIGDVLRKWKIKKECRNIIFDPRD
ncbi:MAG TPA: DUF502 domain-containing protein [Chitinispirillaceae bacterium]|nr:DUF502 domain-containing protein [Chitinispirillaceae bacterium]